MIQYAGAKYIIYRVFFSSYEHIVKSPWKSVFLFECASVRKAEKQIQSQTSQLPVTGPEKGKIIDCHVQ